MSDSRDKELSSTGVSVSAKKEPCLGCRITGTMTLLGLTGYTLSVRQTIPKSNPRYRMFLSGLAACTSLVCYRVYFHDYIWEKTPSSK